MRVPHRRHRQQRHREITYQRSHRRPGGCDVPKVSLPVAAGKKTKARPLPVVRSPVAGETGRAQSSEVAIASQGGRGSIRKANQRAACARIVDGANQLGWGFRVCLLGRSGSGKTHFEKALISYALATGAADIALVYDHKDPRPSFAGEVRRNVAEFAAAPYCADGSPPRVVVFHEDAPGEPDTVAELAMALGVRTLFVNDEVFPDSVTEGGQKFRNGATSPQPILLRTGRSRAASGAWGTQMPQEMPTAIMDLCETQVVFGLQGRGLDYLVRERRIPSEAGDVVRGLQRGECILICEGAWDGTTYGPA